MKAGFTKVGDVELTFRDIGPCITAYFKCLNKHCKKDHLLGTIDGNLWKVPAVRKAWEEGMQNVSLEVAREMLRIAGYDLSDLTFAPEAEMN